MAIIGPNPVHYQNQPQLLATHRQVFDLLARRVQENRTEPLDVATQGQVSDAFEHARQAPPQADTPETPAGALARLATGFYNRLIQLGLLPARETQAVEHSMAGYSRQMIEAMEAHNSQALQYLYNMHEARTNAAIRPAAQAPEGFALIGRNPHPRTTHAVAGDGVSRYHLTALTQGDHLVLRDGFFEMPADPNLPATGQRIEWVGSLNGSTYYDEHEYAQTIPSDQPIVIPNRRVLLGLGDNLYWYDQGHLQPAPAGTLRGIQERRLTRALGELQQGQRQDIVLGRNGNVPVKGPGMSRQHARITWDGQGFSIQDLESTNGTHMDVHDQVDPVPVPSDRAIPLIAGSQLVLGSTVLRFNPPVPPVSPV